MKHKGKNTPLAKGEVVIMNDKEHNCSKWKHRIMKVLTSEPDGIVQVAKLQTGKGILEQAVQHQSELSYDKENKQAPVEFNPKP